MKLETLFVHAGRRPDPTGAISPPIHLSTTFERNERNELVGDFSYVREGNPTEALLEEALAPLEGGEAALAFGSGMAAAAALLQSLESGAHIVIPDDAYYGVRVAAEDFLRPWGISTDVVPMDDLAALAAALRPEDATRVARVPIEPAPEGHRSLGRDRDRPGGGRGHRRGQHFRDTGAPAPARARRRRRPPRDDEIHRRALGSAGRRPRLPRARSSSTRRRGTRATSSEAWGLRSIPGWRCAGCGRSPCASSARAPPRSRSRGRSPAIRRSPPCTIRVSSRTPDTPWRSARCPPSAGCSPSACAAGREAAIRAVTRCRLWTRATSLGGVESLIEHRATSEGAGSRAPAELVRLSVGLEHPDDLVADLEQALTG